MSKDVVKALNTRLFVLKNQGQLDNLQTYAGSINETVNTARQDQSVPVSLRRTSIGPQKQKTLVERKKSGKPSP